MNGMKSCILVAVVLAVVLAPASVRAGEASLELPALIANNMVLQRDEPVAIWGWARPRAKVTVAFAAQTASTTADADGRWKLKLEPLAASAEPREMTVASGDQKVTLANVLVGDLWVCSGQSNMEWPMSRDPDGQKELPRAAEAKLRYICMQNDFAAAPKERCKKKYPWQVSGPKATAYWGSVAYFFGKHVSREVGVPVGLIHSAWGGTLIEAWTPATDAARANPGARVGKNSPAALYNAMIHPLTPMTVRGVIWYQGETNVINRDKAYLRHMTEFIERWRVAWGKKNLPVYYVQIAPHTYGGGEALPLVWEAQRQALAIPRTGMAVITDQVDTVADIHPTRKAEVGRRLALWALADEYGREGLVYSGPLYKSMEVDGDKAIVRFDHLGGGLKSRDGKPLTYWEIAGADGAWHPGAAKIVGETVEVTSPKVHAPTAVRFAWDETAQPNLINAEALPASPFRARVEQ